MHHSLKIGHLVIKCQAQLLLDPRKRKDCDHFVVFGWQYASLYMSKSSRT
jgi:hypothetical protein